MKILKKIIYKALELYTHPLPQAFSGTMSNLQRFATGEDPILHTAVSDAWKTMAVVEACYASSKKNKRVTGKTRIVSHKGHGGHQEIAFNLGRPHLF